MTNTAIRAQGVVFLARQIKRREAGGELPLAQLVSSRRMRLLLPPGSGECASDSMTDRRRHWYPIARDDGAENESACKRVVLTPHEACAFTNYVEVDGKRRFLLEDDGEWLSPARYTLKSLSGALMSVGGSVAQCLEKAGVARARV